MGCVLLNLTKEYDLKPQVGRPWYGLVYVDYGPLGLYSSKCDYVKILKPQFEREPTARNYYRPRFFCTKILHTMSISLDTGTE